MNGFHLNMDEKWSMMDGFHPFGKNYPMGGDKWTSSIMNGKWMFVDEFHACWCWHLWHQTSSIINGCLWMNFIHDDVDDDIGIYPWHYFVTWMENEVLLTFATIQNLEVYQMDVKATFFNDDLSKEIYMQQLEGFMMKCKENIIM